MDQLIELIRAATASGATTEHKAAGAQACRTILAALDTEPGKPLAPPIAASAPTRPSLDQILDMAIARLTTIANARDTAAVPVTQKVSALPRQLPTGLRVPAALPSGKPAKQPAIKPTSTRKP
jgi:hypothetical protein